MRTLFALLLYVSSLYGAGNADVVYIEYDHYVLQNCNLGYCTKTRVIDIGNGTLIGHLQSGAAIVVTAAHCVRPHPQFPQDQVTVHYYVNDRPYEAQGTVFARYDEPNSNTDLAFIAVRLPSSASYHAGLALLDREPGEAVEMAVYLRGEWSRLYGQVTSDNPPTVSCPTVQGHSGAGIFCQETQTLIGVLSSGDSQGSYYTPASVIWRKLRERDVMITRNNRPGPSPYAQPQYTQPSCKAPGPSNPAPTPPPLQPEPLRPIPQTEPLPIAQPPIGSPTPIADNRLDTIMKGIENLNKRLDTIESNQEKQGRTLTNRINEVECKSVVADSTIKSEIDAARQEAKRQQDAIDGKLNKVENEVLATSKKIATLKPGIDGRHGRDGKDGQPGKDGSNGRDGQDATVDYRKLAEALQQRLASETTPKPGTAPKPGGPAYIRITPLP